MAQETQAQAQAQAPAGNIERNHPHPFLRSTFMGLLLCVIHEQNTRVLGPHFPGIIPQGFVIEYPQNFLTRGWRQNGILFLDSRSRGCGSRVSVSGQKKSSSVYCVRCEPIGMREGREDKNIRFPRLALSLALHRRMRMLLPRALLLFIPKPTLVRRPRRVIPRFDKDTRKSSPISPLPRSHLTQPNQKNQTAQIHTFASSPPRPPPSPPAPRLSCPLY